jgi:serine/threonine-protein kinase
MARQIGRYQIERELGQGGMATVYLALDSLFERRVAIKVLPRQFTEDLRSLQRFEGEAKMIASLEDPAIVPVYDFGQDEGWPYLVMRYMSGGTLGERMVGQPLALEEVSRYLNRLAPALDLAHEKGIIHRDLKPDNVLFDGEGRPYLADFGIAQLTEATHTVTLRGTPAYMSPEQVQEDEDLDGRSDIYALGVMLYEMLAGVQPYVAQTTVKQLLMHVTEPVPDVLAANPDLPAGTQAVIDKVMAKDREERYQTAMELAEAVQQLMAQPTAKIEPPVVAVQQTVQDEAGPEAVPDTSAEELVAEASVVSAVEEKTQESAPFPPSLEKKGSEARLRLPAWAWWVGAIVVVLLLAFGIRSIFGGGGDDMPEATDESGVEIAAVVSSATATTTPEPVNTATAEPSPRATQDPNLPPPEPTLGSVWERPQDKMAMVYVPAGTFLMGSEDGDSDEIPMHDVTLDGFWVDETEVTNAHYKQCVDAGECEASSYEDDSTYNGDRYPVVGVSWNDADAYCRWTGGQLSTEAQWEYAARGPEGKKYPWGEEEPTCELAQYGECGDGTVPVGSYSEGVSWAGALDMAGNVWEWTNDWYDSEQYANAVVENPTGPEIGEFKVLRGGSWPDGSFSLRSADRIGSVPAGRNADIGFRCVLPGR